MADQSAFSTGNAFIVLHEDAQRIERYYLAQIEKLAKSNRAMRRKLASL